MPHRPHRTPDVAAADEELLEGIRSGSQAAFHRLYDRYFGRVYKFAYSRVRNHADAEEVVQETFIAVFRSIGAYAGRASLLSWIYGIARNHANNHVRRSRAYGARLERAEPELRLCGGSSLASCTPEDRLELKRGADAIQERLESISRWQAEVFVLRHLENLPIGEIARRTHRSNDAVRSSLYRVKRLLIDAVDPGLAPTG